MERCAVASTARPQAKRENLAGAGTSVGVQVWRIEQFKVVNVDKTDYGHFFTGYVRRLENPSSTEII